MRGNEQISSLYFPNSKRSGPFLLLYILRIAILYAGLLLFVLTGRLMAQFANGADVGWLSQMEASGVVFKDTNGVQKNCLDILKEKGINALRFRVWVNPSGGYCGKKDVAYMAHRANSMGFGVLIDFHLSDTWADPQKQYIPSAWRKDSANYLALAGDVYNHIYSVLDTLKQLGVVPKWIQVGNEVDNGVLWNTGKASIHMDYFAKIIDTGYAAAKAVDSSIQVIVHLSNGHDNAMYRWMFDNLRRYGARWDIIGMSVYPYWAKLPWQTDDSLAFLNMKDMIARYHTKVMVVETGYSYNDPITANHFLNDLIAKTKSAGGLGVFYWEPECYPPWAGGYSLGAWDPITKEPTVALDAFRGIVVTAVNQRRNVPAYGVNVYPNPFNPGTTIEFEVPSLSTVSIAVYNVLGEKVATIVDNRIEDAGTHAVKWSPISASSGVYFCRMIAGDFVGVKKILLIK